MSSSKINAASPSDSDWQKFLSLGHPSQFSSDPSAVSHFTPSNDPPHMLSFKHSGRTPHLPNPQAPILSQPTMNNTHNGGGLVYSQLAQRALRHLERVERSRNTVPPHPLYTSRTAELESLARARHSRQRMQSDLMPSLGQLTTSHQPADAWHTASYGGLCSVMGNAGWPSKNYGLNVHSAWPAYYLPSDHFFPCLRCKNCWTHPFHHCFHKHHNLWEVELI